MKENLTALHGVIMLSLIKALHRRRSKAVGCQRVKDQSQSHLEKPTPTRWSTWGEQQRSKLLYGCVVQRACRSSPYRLVDSVIRHPPPPPLPPSRAADLGSILINFSHGSFFFFQVKWCQRLQSWYSSGYPVRRLTFLQHWDWSAECQ